MELADPRFAANDVHYELDALDLDDIRPLREHRTPEGILGWIDAEFGGVLSSEATTGGIWIAEDADGPLAFAAYGAARPKYHWLRAWSTRPDVGIFGPFGVVARARGRHIGTTLLHAALFSLRERGYRYALVPCVSDPQLIAFYERYAAARIVEEFEVDRPRQLARTVVLASGNGSNFQGVLDGAAAGRLPLDVVALVANRPQAFALERARAAHVPSAVVAWDRATERRGAYDERVIACVAGFEPALVLLLGWMHVLPPAFFRPFNDVLNVHPAFLPLDPELDAVTAPDGSTIPAYRGAHAFDDALSAGSRWAGATVHRVGAAVDRGEVLARAPLALPAGAERAVLYERLHAVERIVVATAVRRWGWEQP